MLFVYGGTFVVLTCVGCGQEKGRKLDWLYEKTGEVLWVCMLSCSVVSDSSQPSGLQPTRLLCPLDFPGINPGVGCCALLQGIFLTQWSNPCLSCLLHYRWILYPLSRWSFPPGEKRWILEAKKPRPLFPEVGVGGRMLRKIEKKREIWGGGGLPGVGLWHKLLQLRVSGNVILSLVLTT